jgi:hypothetical protein
MAAKKHLERVSEPLHPKFGIPAVLRQSARVVSRTLSPQPPRHMERAMLAPLKYLIAFPAFFLVLFGVMPVAGSAMYGGHPPPHIASLLDKQMDTFSAVARMIFGPITPTTPAAAGNEKNVSNLARP